jgi:hypothetical protein
MIGAPKSRENIDLPPPRPGVGDEDASSEMRKTFRFGKLNLPEGLALIGVD